ncbi:hypothetical protein PFISCL1PPCAC_3368, partial [Pristionchus fissidentatus]
QFDNVTMRFFFCGTCDQPTEVPKIKDEIHVEQPQPTEEYKIAVQNNEIEKKWDLKLVEIRMAAPSQSWGELLKEIDKVYAHPDETSSEEFEKEKQRFGRSIDRSLVEVEANIRWVSDLYKQRPEATFLDTVKDNLHEVKFAICRLQAALKEVQPTSASILSPLWQSVQRAYDDIPDVAELKRNSSFVTKQPMIIVPL